MAVTYPLPGSNAPITPLQTDPGQSQRDLGQPRADLGEADPAAVATDLRLKLFAFVLPLLQQLDEAIDRRLVRTFLCTLEAILRLRSRAHGLLLSELGAYLMSPEHAPAGTKRLSNLLHSNKWTAKIIDRFLWEQAKIHWRQISEGTALVSEEITLDQEQPDEEKQTHQCQQLMLWDESVIEKPESRKLEGLCPVLSSKGKRLTRIKPGYFSPPAKPIHVPGMNWICLLLTGLTGAPIVAAMRWWSTRGVLTQDKRALQIALLQRCRETFGKGILHVFDRGYAGMPWIEQLLIHKADFLMRWPARYKLIAYGDPLWQLRSASDLARGKRSVDHRMVWDAHKRCESKRGILFFRVWTPDTKQQLWLVVCRRPGGEAPWYLVTNVEVRSKEEAWRLVFAYVRRWQIEMCWRYNKSELGMESPRLWHWEQREKIMMMATVVYAFLLSLLEASLAAMCCWLLRHFCHRTGKRSRLTAAPLYRLRSAIARLWNLKVCPPIYKTQAQNSG